jgi:CheY-like chemotaxis protein
MGGKMTKLSQTKNVVIYADDDPDDLEFVKDSFARYSPYVEVVTARDGVEALSILSELSPMEPTPCLIILDINMPRLNGKETLLDIRKMKRYESVPVVLFTTSSLPADKNFASKHNIGFITKPLNSSQMELITDQFIEHCTDEVKKNIRRNAN